MKPVNYDFLTKEVLEDLYFKQHLSLEKIGIKFKVSRITITKHMKKFGLPIRKGRDIHNHRCQDINGKIFGRLLVLREDGYGTRNKVMILCKCNCGKSEFTKEVRVPRSDVLGGKKSSCGCLYKELLQTKHHAVGEIRKSVVEKILKRAGARNIQFNVSIEYLWELFLKQNRKCAITTVEISFDHNRKKKKLQTASLDRIDPSKGYIEGNVQWVHKTVNYMKWTLGANEFIDWCYKVVRNYEKQYERNN